MASTADSNPRPLAAKSVASPHRRIAGDDPRERFLAELLDDLWERYRNRVEYVQTYERVIEQSGGTFVNDHIAFRTFASQEPMTGIASVARIFEALGYSAAGCYRFADKHLSAVHFQHSNYLLPKIFISELQTWELSRSARETIEAVIADHRPPLSSETLARLRAVGDESDESRRELQSAVLHEFNELPWTPPERSDVTELNGESQYAAWVLVHGYNVNHFTCSVNSHAAASLDDIDKTIEALRQAGVPMKADIEGEPGSKLRQSATEAVIIDVPVREDGKPSSMPWTYAYLELAERGQVVDPETGRKTRFEGFLGPQATQLFEMTRAKTNIAANQRFSGR